MYCRYWIHAQAAKAANPEVIVGDSHIMQQSYGIAPTATPLTGPRAALIFLFSIHGAACGIEFIHIKKFTFIGLMAFNFTIDSFRVLTRVSANDSPLFIKATRLP